MNPSEIKTFLDTQQTKRARTLVIVDFGNVEKWKESLGWRVGIQELARLTKKFSGGARHLRRFYYGSDYGKSERSHTLSMWSQQMIQRAEMNGFTVVTKRVKYIHDGDRFAKKCDLDVEMAVDLIRLQEEYDTVVLFSGDGDLIYALRYVADQYGKEAYVFGARNHVGKEVIDAKNSGVVQRLLFAEDFEYRLNMDRFRTR